MYARKIKGEGWPMVERRVTGKQQGVDTLPSPVLTCLCKAMGVTLPKKAECICTPEAGLCIVGGI